jgi:hypothetical protein
VFPDSSHEVHQGAPPSFKLCASTPRNPKTSFGQEMPISRHVPSMSFLTTTTVYSAQRPAGLLHPASDHRVRLVSQAWSPKAPRLILQNAAAPLEAFPSLPAVGGHTPKGVSPAFRPHSPLHQCSTTCCHVAKPPSLDLWVLIRQRVRCSTITVASEGEPDAPWAYGLTRR